MTSKSPVVHSKSRGEHTQGPWHVVDAPSRGLEVHWRLPQQGQLDAPVCHLRWTDGLNEEVNRRVAADARLIAAAPMLLEALQQLHDEDMDYIRINNLSGAENNQVLRNARAAIAMARGTA